MNTPNISSMNREVSVVIPIYTTELNDFEILSLKRTIAPEFGLAALRHAFEFGRLSCGVF